MLGVFVISRNFGNGEGKLRSGPCFNFHKSILAPVALLDSGRRSFLKGKKCSALIDRNKCNKHAQIL